MSNLRYYQKGGRTYVSVAPEGTKICDFCSNQPVIRIYVAKDINIDPRHESEGGWCACAPCAELIDANDREGLFDRAMIKLSHTLEADADELAGALRLVQSKFWEAKVPDKTEIQ